MNLAEPLHSILDLSDLPSRQAYADRLLSAEGAGHIVHDLPTRADGRSVSLESRPWRMDPIPYVLEAAEFTYLADAARARMRMLESIIADLYGAQSLITNGLIDARVVWGSTRYRLAEIGAPAPKRWLTCYAVDLAKDADGVWHVIQDVTDAPAGVGYSLLGRSVMARVHRDAISRLPSGSGLRLLEPFADQLRDGLADVAGNESPRIVVMSGGVDHSSFVEQSYLATRLGLNLAEGADLVVRQRRLWLRSLAGLEPVDVVFRRLEDDRLDPMEVNTVGSAGVPGILLAARADGVRLANGHGTGVIEDPELAEFWDESGPWLAGRQGADDALPIRRMSAAFRPTTPWATTPVFDGFAGTERPVVLRLQLVASDRGVDVLQGGTARVLNPGDDPTIPTSAIAKDVWVVGGSVAPPRVKRRHPLPQVDLIASVPTRAAEALFWAGRAMERAEITARAIEVVIGRTSGVVAEQLAEPWVGPAVDMLAAVAGVADAADVAGPDRANLVLAASFSSLTSQLGSLLAEVSSVREFFSVTAGRVFSRLAETRGELQIAGRPAASGWTSPIDTGLVDSRLLESALIDIASLTGLWNESVVHGPAWRFGEVGRRLERAFGVVDVARGAFGVFGVDGAPTRRVGLDTEYDQQRLIEVFLATNESLVAYRRRYRSDVEFTQAMQLVVAGTSNPRSAAAAIAAVGREAAELGWDDGVASSSTMLEAIRAAEFVSITELNDVLGDVWTRCDRLARDVVSSRLATPVDPRLMGWS